MASHLIVIVIRSLITSARALGGTIIMMMTHQTRVHLRHLIIIEQ